MIDKTNILVRALRDHAHLCSLCEDNPALGTIKPDRDCPEGQRLAHELAKEMNA